MTSLFNKAAGAVKGYQPSITVPAQNITNKLGVHDTINAVNDWLGKKDPTLKHRYDSSADIRSGNSVKYHVDGCAYFWAVSEALERATESIWILGWWISPELYLRRPPSSNEQYRLDRMLLAAANRGVKINVVVFKEVPQVMYLSSHHTKRALEALHPNISVFRHPDHYTGVKGTMSGAKSTLESVMSGGFAGLGKVSDETLSNMFAAAGSPTLFWAHHEKLVIVDQQTVFMGGIDLSYGRWDTVQHPITDTHPENLDEIVFPGQDYNNARVMDFKNLDDWERNKLSRLTTSRMGWQDISFSVQGPVVTDVCQHFVDRWNFIFGKKYNSGLPKDCRYTRLPPLCGPPITQPETWPVQCQFVRSVTNWSSGKALEHSIYNAYIDIIGKSEHFIYIEQQFFVTATGTWMGTVWNRVGEALVQRIIRAAKEKKNFKVMVVLPAVPAFPGDLQALISGHPPRIIMKLQYKSISRGGYSILDKLKQAGIDSSNYIRFYNLRSYDRINATKTMQKIEAESGVNYKLASQDHDDQVDPFGLRAQKEVGEFEGDQIPANHEAYKKYQKAAGPSHGTWDSVSECPMLPQDSGPTDIRNVPWQGNPADEIDAFVSEELYVHSKLMIVDDRIVICGSANLNDRSLRGSRDSEVAMVIQDTSMVDSEMDGKPYKAAKFAASLRRYLTRKHVGMLYPQDMDKPDSHFHAAPGENDTFDNSIMEHIVRDPLSKPFQDHFNNVAHTNTLAFRKVFAPQPDDTAQTWIQYQALFWQRFQSPDGLHMAQWGHVMKNNFPPGEEGAKAVKEELGKIKGHVVEFPLEFLGKSNIQITDPAYNLITMQGYV